MLGYPALSATQDFEAFLKPLQVILGSTFLTSRAVGAHMMRQNSGIEALTRSLAGEFGPAGVRVNCVRGSAMPETRTIQEIGMGIARLFGTPEVSAQPTGSDTLLRRPITVAETAATALFLASDAASGLTGQIVTVCAGAFVG